MTLKLVSNEEKYYEFIRELRNNPKNQDGWIDQNPNITSEQQLSYMKKYNDNYYVGLVDGVPAGYIGQIDGDIRIATHPNFRRKGLAVFMLKELIKLHPGGCAKIKIGNIASEKTFLKAGFVLKFGLYEYDSEKE